MKVESTKISTAKEIIRPYLCSAEGAIWMAENDEGFVCVDPLGSNYELGDYEERLDEVMLYEGSVTLKN